MTTRIECDLDGLAANWVEIQDEGWSRRETMKLLALPDDDALYTFLRDTGKLIACHLELTTGQAIDTPAGITEDAMLDADEALIAWLTRTGWVAIARRRALGNASARLSSNAKETTA
jgi:hypothetical protein